MNKNTKSRITTVVAGAALLAVFGGGSAVAGSLITSAQIKDNTIRSADVLNGGLRGVDVKDGSLRGVDVADGSLRSADIADGAVQGADIADGTVQGADIADGSLTNQDINVLTASVNQDGTLVHSSGGVTVEKLANATYSVDFGRVINACAFFATAGGVNVGIDVGQVNVSDKASNTEAVFVETNDSSGANKEMDFHLAVIC